MANVVQIVIKALDQTKAGLTTPITNLKSLEKAASSMATVITGAGVAVAGSLFAMTAHAINTADAMFELSQRANVSVEFISRLVHAADMAGVGVSQLETGFKFLNKAMAEAAGNASSEVALAFRAVGISLKDAAGQAKSNEQIFFELSQKFSGFEDSANKAALAMKLFGKSGTDMLPLLNQGADGIKEAMSEVMGVTTESAKRADEFKDNIARLKAQLSDAGVAIANEMLPALVQASNAMVTFGKEADIARGLGSALKDAIQFIGFYAMQAATGFEMMIHALELVKNTIAGAKKMLGELTPIVLELGVNAAKAAKDLAFGDKSLATALVAVFKPLGKSLDDAIKKQDGGLDTMAEAWKQYEAVQADAVKRLQESQNELFVPPAFFTRATDPDGGLTPGPKTEAPNLGEVKKTQQLAVELDKRSIMQIEHEAGNVAAFMQAQNSMLEAERFATQQRQELLTTYSQFWQESHRTMFSYVAEASRTLYNGISNAITGIITGTVKAAEAFKQLGLQMVNMVVQFIVQRGIAFALEKALGLAGLAMAKAQAIAVTGIAGGLAAAWAPAATAALIATYGNAASAATLLGPAMAANQAMAKGMTIAGGALGGAAHGGLDFVPAEQTFLLNRGERVIQPAANKELTQFLAQQRESGGSSGPTHIHVSVNGRELFEIIQDASRTGQLTIASRAVV